MLLRIGLWLHMNLREDAQCLFNDYIVTLTIGTLVAGVATPKMSHMSIIM